ncbi:MAG: HPP family protein [Candidatus Hydrothermarchaeaceae archaeon]
MVEMIGVADIMSTKLISMEREASIKDAAKLLIEKGVSSLVVEGSGKVSGIVSLRDVLKIEPDAIYGYKSQKG